MNFEGLNPVESRYDFHRTAENSNHDGFQKRVSDIPELGHLVPKRNPPSCGVRASPIYDTTCKYEKWFQQVHAE